MLRHKYGKRKKYKFTLAMLVQRIVYMVNGNTELIEIDDNHGLHRAEAISRWSVWLIVLLGVLGRMHDELQTYDGETWYNALLKIFTESDINHLLEYIGGALIAYVLLLATEFILSMAHEQWVAVGGNADESFFDITEAQWELDQNYIRYLHAVAYQRWSRKKAHVLKRYEELKALPTPSETQSEPETVYLPNETDEQ